MNTHQRAWIVLILGGVACTRQPEPFRVVSIAPDPQAGALRLNQPIVVRFSRPVDPSSAHAASVVVRDDSGAPARGNVRVGVDTVTFVPKPPKDASFTDAGLRPGTSIEVALAGFPARDGVLSSDGDPIAQAFRARYQVVVPTGEGSGFDAFVDPSPSSVPRLKNGERLRGVAATVAPGGTLWLEFSEPLAPRTVTAAAFDLRFENAERERVPFAIEFHQRGSAAAVAVRPLAEFRRDTRYVLIASPSTRLCDLVGNPIDDIAPISFLCAENGEAELGRSKLDDS